MVLNILIHEHKISFYSFMSSLVSHRNVLLFSVYKSFATLVILFLSTVHPWTM